MITEWINDGYGTLAAPGIEVAGWYRFGARRPVLDARSMDGSGRGAKVYGAWDTWGYFETEDVRAFEGLPIGGWPTPELTLTLDDGRAVLASPQRYDDLRGGGWVGVLLHFSTTRQATARIREFLGALDGRPQG